VRLIELIAIVMILALLWVPVVPAQKAQWSGNGHYYEAVLNKVSWDDANAQAQSKGGYLATITSADENQFVYGLIAVDDRYWTIDGAGNNEGAWLGGYQPKDSAEPSGGWTWVTGEPFSYTNWASGEPNNNGGNENQLIFFSLGATKSPTWNDFGNSNVNSYIIEWDASQDSGMGGIRQCGSQFEECASIWGPIEPTGAEGAAPMKPQGKYMLVYAEVPKSSDPAQSLYVNWNWKNFGPVDLNGGKRYFLVFGSSSDPELFEEQNLPIQETKVTATEGWATIWASNKADSDISYAYCWQSVSTALSGCDWHAFKPEGGYTAFAGQPGGVFPLNETFTAGNYLVHVGPAGKFGLDTPTTWNTFGPYNLRAQQKYRALIQLTGVGEAGPLPIGLRWDEDPADLVRYSKPEVGKANVYVRNTVLGDIFYAICLTPVGNMPVTTKGTVIPSKTGSSYLDNFFE
jgi:hypothetical protein